MRLQFRHYPVHSLKVGETTGYQNGALTVNLQHLVAHLEAAGDLAEVHLTELALVVPGTSTRLVNIFDLFAARARLGDQEGDYPGVLGPLQSVGHGETATLDNFAVTACSCVPDRNNKVLDMTGPGAELTPHAQMFHLAFRAEPRRSDLTTTAYWRSLKQIGLRIGTHLARATVATAPAPVRETVYELTPVRPGLPRIAYVCMIASHQKASAGVPVLYGDDAAGLLPTVLHPNEMLDGGVIAPDWNLGIDTYTYQNNPVLLDLYQRHGTEVDFAGVVVTAAHATRIRRERSVLMAANLVKSILKADLAVVTKTGGGMPESDLMMTVEALERRGVATSGAIWASQNDGTFADSLTTQSPAANALASVGIESADFELPAQDVAYGGSTAGPYTESAADSPVAATGPIRLRTRDISGAISQMGASRVAMVEY